MIFNTLNRKNRLRKEWKGSYLWTVPVSGQTVIISMEHNEILARIEGKILRLGEARRALDLQVQKLKEELASVYKINKELQVQLDELTESNRELEQTRSLQPAVQEDFRHATRQRINDLVREIDECIALLNS